MAIHSLFELPRTTALALGTKLGSEGNLALGMAEGLTLGNDFKHFDIVVNNTGIRYREQGTRRAGNHRDEAAWQDQILCQFNLIAAPMAQLRDAGHSVPESEKKRLCNIIGHQAALLMHLVNQLDPEEDVQNLTFAGVSRQAADIQHDVHAQPASSDGGKPADHGQIALFQPPTGEPVFSMPIGRRRSAYDDELLQKLMGLMEENLEETDFNVHKMCSMMHLSHMHLIRKVKQLTGKKPIDLLKAFRLQKAKNLLLQRKLTVAEIAYKVGYDMPNSFSRAFKKEFGISPTTFAV